MSQVKRNRVFSVNSDNRIQELVTKKFARAQADLNQVTDFQAFIDGPVTFISFKFADRVLTGWSKFNANDRNYSELQGISQALQRAIDKIV